MPVVVYLMNRLQQLDKQLMEKYCLKGVSSQQGFLRIHRNLNTRVTFGQVKLMKFMPPNLGKSEVIFLCKVLIYSDRESKRQVELHDDHLEARRLFSSFIRKACMSSRKSCGYSTLDLP